MEYDYDSARHYDNDLAQLFFRFYPANVVKWLYQEVYCKISKEKASPKPPIKAQMIKKLLMVSEDIEQSQAFVDALPKDLKQVMERLMWVDSADGISLQEELGYAIFDSDEDDGFGHYGFNNRKQQKLKTIPIRMELIVNHPRARFYHSRDGRFETNDLSLPPALRKWLRPFFPKPEGYYFEAADELVASEDWRRFDGHADSLQALAHIADHIERGALDLGKNGKPSKATMRQLAKVSGCKEFYPPEKEYQGLHHLRHELLVQWMIDYSHPILRKFTEGKIEPKKFFRALLEEIPEAIEFIYEQLLPHIKTRYGDSPFDPDLEQNAILEKAIHDLFAALPESTWITRGNLHDYRRYRDIAIQPPRPYAYSTSVRELESDYYAKSPHKVDIDDSNFDDLITAPLLDGLCALLAAFGILEIAYGFPVNEFYARTKKNNYLTPLEGILAVRLTPIGAYALCKTDALEVETVKVERSELVFHSERLHLTVDNPDPITEKALDEFLQRLGPGHYQFSRAAIIGSASTLEGFKSRVASFKQQLGSDLPQNWKAAIASLEKEPTALSKRTSVEVYQVSDAPGLRDAFATDRVLRELCTRAENWEIVVEKKDIDKLQKRLQSLGFICK